MIRGEAHDSAQEGYPDAFLRPLEAPLGRGGGDPQCLASLAPAVMQYHVAPEQFLATDVIEIFGKETARVRSPYRLIVQAAWGRSVGTAVLAEAGASG